MITSAISFKDVSAPKLNSVPGTLLLMVAGKTVIGMQNCGYLSLAAAISWTDLYASKPPTTTKPEILCFPKCSAIFGRNVSAVILNEKK